MQGAMTLSFSGVRIGAFEPKQQKLSFACRKKTRISAGFVAEKTRTRSLYEVLRVSKDASLKEIKAAYRTLAKLYHPDVSQGGDFTEINEAYARLSDPEARAQYDAALGFRPTPHHHYYTGRRWETDQCW